MNLYRTDFVRWAQKQADILRLMPETHSLDIEHLTDEIEGLGRTALADLSNAIRQLLSGLVHRSIDPASIILENIYSAQSEAIIRADAGVWRHVDLDRIWRLAIRKMDANLPQRCPITIEQIVAEDFDVEKMLSLSRP